MSELELLNLARDAGQTVTSDLGQVITITFAMVVAIYYFLHQAGIRMKLFAFAVYTCGIAVYVCLMVMETNVGHAAQQALLAIPETARSLPTRFYLGVRTSLVGTLATILFNLVYWVLWLGTGYLLFFWKKPPNIQAPHA